MVNENPTPGIIGSVLLILAGIQIGFTNITYASEIIVHKPTIAVGIVSASVISLAGVGALLRFFGLADTSQPDLSTILGIVGITFSLIATIIGFWSLSGAVIGVIGGTLCVIGKPPHSVGEKQKDGVDTV